jgi:hypothetical protein
MVNFSDQEGVQRWIEARPEATRRRDATVLASRAALRVWPLVGGGVNRSGEPEFGGSVFASARANALARAAAKYPARAGELRFAYSGYAAFARAATAADGFAGFAYASSVAAVTAAYLPVDFSTDFSADFATERAAANAARVVANAANAAEDDLARSVIWRMTSVEASHLESSLDAHRLIDYPLWGTQHGIGVPGSAGQPAAAPNVIDEHWRQLEAALPKRTGENWQVWLDWYEAILNGRPPWPALSEKQREDLTVAIALIDEKVWRQGPAVANAEVKRLIDEAHAKIEKSPEQKEAKSPIVPPPKPAAIEPTWRHGQLVAPREAIAADLSPEDFLAVLRAARADCFELVRDVRAEVEEAERLGRTPNLDLRPANYLERAASRIGDTLPSAQELFRFGHAAEALRHGLKAVEETWPDFLAARYGLLVAHLERAARQARAWRALLKNAAEDAPPREVVEAAPRYAIEFAEILREADAATAEPPLIAASIPDGLDVLAGIAEERAEIAGSATPAIDAGAEALAVDLIDSIDNIVKKLAEAWLAIGRPLGAVAKKTGAALGHGLSENLPVQAKALGKMLAKIAIWGPMVGGAGYLAGHFAWFAPIAKMLLKAFTG